MKQVWFDRDSFVGDAFKVHQKWLRQTKRDLEQGIKNITDILGDIREDIASDVVNDKKLAQNRLYALKLVLGQPAGHFEKDIDGFELDDPCGAAEVVADSAAAVKYIRIPLASLAD